MTGTQDKVLLLLMNYCGSHDSLRNSEGCVWIFTFPPNGTDKRQPMDAGIIAATKLQYRRSLLSRRTSLVAEITGPRARAHVTNMRAVTRGLSQDCSPHLLDAARLLMDA